MNRINRSFLDAHINYDKIATTFDTVRQQQFREKSILDEFLKLLPTEGNILDVGCGSGLPLMKHMIDKGFKITGIDQSKKLLELARKRFTDVVLINESMLNVKLNRFFDAIVAWDSLFHVTQNEQKSMIKRFSTWLQPGGKLLFTSGDEFGEVQSLMFGEYFNYYSLSTSDYLKTLSEAGFEDISQIKDQGLEPHLVWTATLTSP